MEGAQIYGGQIFLQKECEVIAGAPKTKAHNTKLFVVTVNELVTSKAPVMRTRRPENSEL